MRFFRKLLKRWYLTVPALLLTVALCVYVLPKAAVSLALSMVLIDRGDWEYDGLPGNYFLFRANSQSISIQCAGSHVGVPGYVYKLTWDDRYLYAARVMDPAYGQTEFDDSLADYFIIDMIENTITKPMSQEDFLTEYRHLTGEVHPNWTPITVFEELARETQ